MSNAVLVEGLDNVLRTSLNFTTSIEEKFFNGTLPQDAISFEVSINGSAFSDDTSLSEWGDGEWVVPSPNYEPNGLFLLEGLNDIKVRAVLFNGSVSNVVQIKVTLVSETNINVVAEPPTNFSVSQKNNSVLLQVEPNVESGFIGMNFYASIFSGGGFSGYQKINVNLVKEGTPTEETLEIANTSSDALVKVDVEGNHVTDPQFFRIRGTQENVGEQELQEDYSEKFEIPEQSKTLRMNISLNTVRDTVLYKFSHNRLAGPNSNPKTVAIGDFASQPNENPLYYVATAVYYDSERNLEYESSYSQEIVARPLAITTALGSFETTTRQNIVEEYITAIFRSNPQIKVEAGSVLRDTVIDPFASEVERLRFVLDFYHRARTPSLLLQIDDPNGTGSSIPVNQSAYKQGLQQAFYLGSAQNTQGLIDGAFDAYASNFGIQRRSGSSAAGEVLFYTTTKPQNTILIPIGTTVSSGTIQFTTTRTASISLSQLASYFNPITGRYQVIVPVRATTSGSTGNVGTGQITTLVSNVGGSVRVLNTAPTVGGRDGEGNLELTERVQNTLASVDSGTERGYLQTAANVPGVVRANVVGAGDRLMQRDLNDSGEHKGGKVDIWVQGAQPTTVTDVFAFTFTVSRDIQFELMGDPLDLIFRATDQTLSDTDPIVEMIDDEALGYALKNTSTGEVFDLQGVKYLTYNTIQLDTGIPQPNVDLTDVVLGSFRKRQGNSYVYSRQPVSSVVNVTGAVSGELPDSAYQSISPNAPLAFGNSTLAGDYLQINGYTDDDGNKIPSGDSIIVESEPHVMIGNYPEFLNNLGANFLSLKVYDSTKTILYKGPNDPSGNPDYQITVGNETTPLSITRVEGGDIQSGDSILIDYVHDENFTVTYETDLIVSLVQQAVDESKHVTADVLAKKAFEIPLDIQATVIYKRGRDVSSVDTQIRSNMANFFNNLRLGDPVRQSDIVNVLENTEGVSYVVVPFTKLVRQEKSNVVREPVSTDTDAESTLISSLTSNTSSVYILNNTLSAATTNGGGSEESFRGVFQNDLTLELLPSSANLESLGVAAGRAYIIGSEGISISGYSDDQTLISEGYVTESAILERRKQLTGNKILVSVELNQDPTQYEYACTYVVGQDIGAKDIDPDKAEYIVAGDLLFTYDEDR